MRTTFTDLLGIDAPVLQAPIGGGSGPELVAAVSNAGGLGFLSVTWRDPSELQELLARTRALTEKPFGVNLVLEWDPAERLATCLAHGVRVASFFWGDPAPWVDRVHAAGALVAHTVATADEARRAVEAGVDIVVAQGWEAGGHVWGQVATMALVPRVVDAVRETGRSVPVIAAGGIADGRGLAAALALGAAGVWMGTRFLLAEESNTHAVYRDQIAAAGETDTAYSELFDGGWPSAPLRALRNSTYRYWEAAGAPATGHRPGEGEPVGRYADGSPILRYASDAPTTLAEGETEAMALYAGQGVGLVNRVQPAGDIVREVVAEAEAVIASLNALVTRPV